MNADGDLLFTMIIFATHVYIIIIIIIVIALF